MGVLTVSHIVIHAINAMDHELHKMKLKAIATIMESRRTHVEWAEWFEKHPNDAESKYLGNEAFHKNIIDEYDNVLKVLESVTLLESLIQKVLNIDLGIPPSNDGPFASERDEGYRESLKEIQSMLKNGLVY